MPKLRAEVTADHKPGLALTLDVRQGVTVYQYGLLCADASTDPTTLRLLMGMQHMTSRDRSSHNGIPRTRLQKFAVVLLG